MKNLCKKITTFILVLCMTLSVFTGAVYAKENDTIVTGDDSYIVLWVLLLSISATCMVVLEIYHRKKAVK